MNVATKAKAVIDALGDKHRCIICDEVPSQFYCFYKAEAKYYRRFGMRLKYDAGICMHCVTAARRNSRIDVDELIYSLLSDNGYLY